MTERILIAGADIETTGIDKNGWIRAAIAAGVYSATPDGQIVRHSRTRPQRLVKTHVHPRTGYLHFTLSWRNEQKCVLAHRFIAICFVPNPHFLPLVNHLDGDKKNNSPRNLEWTDYSGNQKHAYQSGLKSADGERNGQSKLLESEVIELRALRESGWSLNTIALKFNIHRTTAGEICSRKLWNHI